MAKETHTCLPWFRQHAPKKAKDILGQESAVNEIIKFVENFKKQKKKAMLLVGPTGSGKTSAVYAVANDLNLEIIEVNASDFRNEQSINDVLGAAIGQQSLFLRGKLILVDEIDGISGTQDRGGLNAVIKLLEKTTFPLIMTANEVSDYKYNSLKGKCQVVDFMLLQAQPIHSILKKIAEKEGIKISDESLMSLARMSAGDARAAINDLQTIASFSKDSPDLEVLGERNRHDSIKTALLKILKSTDPAIAKNAFDNVDDELDTCLLWLIENLPKEYTKPQDLANAYEMISRADVFRGRIRRWQHWRFLVYVNELITAGVALAKDEKYKSVVEYKPTMKLLKIWMANQRYAKRKAIAQKIAKKTHTSTRVAIQDTVPYIKEIFKKDKEQVEMISGFLELEKDEVDWLKET